MRTPLLCIMLLANAPVVYPQAPAKASAIVYRVGHFTGKALEPSVFCDEVEVARMDNGRYFTIKLDGGKHVIKSNDEATQVILEAKPGESYFIRLNLVRGAWKGWGGVTQVSKETAIEEIKKLKPLGASKVKNTKLVSTEPLELK